MIRGLDPTLFAGLFLLSTFIAAAVVGLAGFAFGLVASGIWLYILSPVQTATMILAFGSWWCRAMRCGCSAERSIGRASGRWSWLGVRHSDRRRDPGGGNPAHLRVRRRPAARALQPLRAGPPAMKPLTAGGVPADVGAGFINGLIGGTTGLAGVFATVWCQLRGGPRDRQRAVFQPVGVASFVMLRPLARWPRRKSHRIRIGWSRSACPADSRMLARLEALRRLDEAQFRKVVLPCCAGVGCGAGLRALAVSLFQLLAGLALSQPIDKIASDNAGSSGPARERRHAKQINIASAHVRIAELPGSSAWSQQTPPPSPTARERKSSSPTARRLP